MQDCVNWLPSVAEQQGTRTAAMAKTPPGLSPYAEGSSGDPVRGLHTAEGRLFAAMGNSFIQVSNTGVLIPRGSISGVLRVKMAHNQITGGNEVIAVNGSAGYIYNTVTQVFQNITDPGYPGAIDALFMDGYFVQIEPARRYAFNSDLADGLSYNTLDRFTSEKSPDLLQALGSTQNDLILFSESTAEFFENTGAAQQPFRSKRISMERGCASRYGVAHMDNTVFWLGNDGKFYVLDGYAPRRISTRPIEQSILGLNWAQAFTFIWESAGHSVVYWTFPDGQTWGYDVSQPPGLQWHRRESYGFDFWRVTDTAYWQNKWIAGDFQSDRLWELDWDYPMEYQDEFISEMTGPVIHDNQSFVKMPRLEFIFDTGQPEVAAREFPEQPAGPTIEGTAPDGVNGEVYGPFTYTVTPGDAPIALVAITSGALPDGLTMNASGTISGTPTESGSFTITVRATDTNGLFDELTDTIEVVASMFVAIANTLTLQKSSNGGATFPTVVTTGLTVVSSAISVMSAGGRLFHFGNSTEGRTSVDGSSFSPCSGLPTVPGGGNMIKVGSEWQLYPGPILDAIYVSTDGESFAIRSLSTSPERPVNRGAIIVAVEAGVSFNVSTDAGNSFSDYTEAAFSSIQRLWSIGSSKFLAFGVDAIGDLIIGSSETGTSGSWTTVAGPESGANSMCHGVYRSSEGRLAIVLRNGHTWYSDDPEADTIVWTQGQTVPYGGALSNPPSRVGNMIYSNGAFFFVAPQGGGVNRIYRSVNGEDAWVQVFQASPTGNSINSMCEYVP